jgi:signal transduction histidine kinase/CheY-like chemotaxis protein
MRSLEAVRRWLALEGSDPYSHRIQVLLALGFGLVILSGATATALVLWTAQVQGLVSHTFEVRAEARRLVSALQDAETGQRGYLLTNQESFLGPFTSALGTLRPTFDELRRLTVDNWQQQERLARVLPLIDAKIDELERTITLSRSGHLDQAIEIVKTARGRDLMEEIRSIFTDFTESERTLLTEREETAASLRNYLLTIIIASLFAILALAWLVLNSTRHQVSQLNDRTKALVSEARRRESAESTLRQAHKMDSLGQLTGGIAHDFNNLLTVIMGNLDTALRRLKGSSSKLSTAVVTPLETALQGTRNAAKLTHRLLAFARQQPLEPVSLDLNALISGVSDMLLRAVGETITIETVLAGGLWPTLADPNQVENALVNLVLNARDSMPAGGKITIETANAYLDDAYAMRFGDLTSGQYVLLSVTDMGTGMAPEILDKVFEPFFTTKVTGEGSGLGLAMVHGFVKQSGGHVRIYSEVGEGTTVKIYLPRLLAAQEPRAVPVPLEIAVARVPRARPDETILIVEDNVDVSEYAASALKELGYRVLMASDGDQAMRMLADETRIDLLFTDVVLPGMNGRQLARKAAERRADLVVLFTTGYTRNAIVHQGRLDADVRLVNKPYTQQELARKIRALLDQRPTGS